MGIKRSAIMFHFKRTFLSVDLSRDTSIYAIYRVGHKKRNQNSKKNINKTTNAIETALCILTSWVMFYQS